MNNKKTYIKKNAGTSKQNLGTSKNELIFKILLPIPLLPIILSLIAANQVDMDKYIQLCLNNFRYALEGRFTLGSLDTTQYLHMLFDYPILMWQPIIVLICFTLMLVAIKYFSKKKLLPFIISYIPLTFLALLSVVGYLGEQGSAYSFLYNRFSYIYAEIRVMWGIWPVLIYSLIGAGFIISAYLVYFRKTEK